VEESRAKPVENRGFSKSPLAEIPRQLCCGDRTSGFLFLRVYYKLL